MIAEIQTLEDNLKIISKNQFMLIQELRDKTKEIIEKTKQIDCIIFQLDERIKKLESQVAFTVWSDEDGKDCFHDY